MISLPSSQEEIVALDALVVPYLVVVDAHQPPFTTAIDRTQFVALLRARRERAPRRRRERRQRLCQARRRAHEQRR